jgi:hypothetical protein
MDLQVNHMFCGCRDDVSPNKCVDDASLRPLDDASLEK